MFEDLSGQMRITALDTLAPYTRTVLGFPETQQDRGCSATECRTRRKTGPR